MIEWKQKTEDMVAEKSEKQGDVVANDLCFEIKPGTYLSFWFTELSKVSFLHFLARKRYPHQTCCLKDYLAPAKEQWDECLAFLYKCD